MDVVINNSLTLPRFLLLRPLRFFAANSLRLLSQNPVHNLDIVRRAN